MFVSAVSILLTWVRHKAYVKKKSNLAWRPHHEAPSHSAGVSVRPSPLKAFPKHILDRHLSSLSLFFYDESVVVVVGAVIASSPQSVALHTWIFMADYSLPSSFLLLCLKTRVQIVIALALSPLQHVGSRLRNECERDAHLSSSTCQR